MGDLTPLRQAGGLTPPGLLTVGHDVSRFACGQGPLDDWLRQRALASEGRSARTYVITENNVVVGYYCLAMGAVSRTDVPRKIRHGLPQPVPVTVIGRLAVDSSYQGQGLGADLLADALKRSVAASEIVGCRGVIVHAIDEAAVSFYRKFDFQIFPPGTQTLFLPLETITNAL